MTTANFDECTEAAAMLVRLTAETMLPAKIRTMEEFADQEIIISTGPAKGTRFECGRNPFVRLWFRELQKGIWRRAVITGPQRSGKTLIGFIIPTLYHLFEMRETVICGLPDLNMVQAKWTIDLEPAIKVSRFADQIPSEGPGSRGGDVVIIMFRDGQVLQFMSGGSRDKGRAGSDSRVVVITETDGFDKKSETSKETKKIKQIEGRTEAWADRAMTYMECTVTVEDGTTWSEYTSGTHSRIAIQCPHCLKWVTPEREHFIGWQEAKNIIEAGELAHIVCSKCGSPWSEQDRIQANQDPRLVHKGQDIADDGTITGTMTPTDTFGFRWNCVNNLLVPMSTIGRREWKAKNSPDEDDSEKEMCQFVWATPSEGTKTDIHKITAAALGAERCMLIRKGDLPPRTVRIGVGVDVGKYFIHWTGISVDEAGNPHIFEYDRLEVIHKDQNGRIDERTAILTALARVRDDVINVGWGGIKPSITCIDAGNWQDLVMQFCKESGPQFMATKGFGDGRFGKLGKQDRQTGSKVIIGPENGAHDYEVIAQPNGDVLLESNADRWKTKLHEALSIPMGRPGAMTFFMSSEHTRFCMHLTAEKGVTEYVVGKGNVVKWIKVRKDNHWLDSTSLATISLDIAALLMKLRSPTPAPASGEVSALSPEHRPPAGQQSNEGMAQPRGNFATGGRPFRP